MSEKNNRQNWRDDREQRRKIKRFSSQIDLLDKKAMKYLRVAIY